MNPSYLAPAHTTRINGIFIIIVWSAHVHGYVEATSPDSFMFGVADWLRQLMVACFLFYSGYGIAQSIARKAGYVRTIPRRQLAVTFVNFAAAILLYLAFGAALGKGFTG